MYNLKRLFIGETILILKSADCHEHKSNTIIFYHEDYNVLVLYAKNTNTLMKIELNEYVEYHEIEIDVFNLENIVKYLKTRYHLEQLLKSTKTYTNLDNVVNLLTIELESGKDSVAKLVKLNINKELSGELNKRLEQTNKIAKGI